LALYEVANGIWKNEFLLKNVKEGAKYISSLLELVDSGSVILVRPDIQLLKKAYQIAAKQKISIYDAIFLALAFETGLELKSLDHTMMDVFQSNR
jgi:predicted nucleic acid-binding protein